MIGRKITWLEDVIFKLSKTLCNTVCACGGIAALVINGLPLLVGTICSTSGPS